VDWSIFLLLLGGFFFIFMLFQRTDPQRRVIVIATMLIALELLRRYVIYRQAETEGLLAFGLALVLAFLFWLFIGRYNRPKSADETTTVLGLDD
jgi:predicted permease